MFDNHPRKQLVARVDRLLHVLWTKAVGSETYVKSEWTDLNGALAELSKIAEDAEDPRCTCDRTGCPVHAARPGAPSESLLVSKIPRRGVDFPCEECRKLEGSTLRDGWYRCDACGYPGK